MWKLAKLNWGAYALEALALGLFMVSACLFGILLEHPNSFIRTAIPSDFLRRLLAGIAMGLTAVGLIYSPIGSVSGAHMNPSVTLANWWLNKLSGIDTVGYIVAQCIGGTLAVFLFKWAVPDLISHPSVNYVVTRPGPQGEVVAFVAEFGISAALFLIILISNTSKRLSPFTGYIAGTLVMLYITFEAPLSGMSINPARTLASGIPANNYTALWLYLIAPIAGMLSASFIFCKMSRVFSKDYAPGKVLAALTGKRDY